MKLVIHQPNYLPYVGFFHKLSLADTLVLMDNTQYDKKFTNRNKIKVPNDSIWITIPINKKQKFSLNKEIEINNDEPWQEDHLKKITRSYTNSNYYKKNYQLVFENFYAKKWDYLFDFNYNMLLQIIEWLGLKIKVIKESELSSKGKSTERIINIANELGAETYLSGVGGKEYMNEKLFLDNNINLEFQNFVCSNYNQVFPEKFIPNLSIIDLLFQNGPESLSILQT
tara:strand:+ start:292 stop:972 length:681 start_codon:yes stop_codon:yes gene_type:complete